MACSRCSSDLQHARIFGMLEKVPPARGTAQSDAGTFSDTDNVESRYKAATPTCAVNYTPIRFPNQLLHKDTHVCQKRARALVDHMTGRRESSCYHAECFVCSLFSGRRQQASKQAPVGRRRIGVFHIPSCTAYSTALSRIQASLEVAK